MRECLKLWTTFQFKEGLNNSVAFSLFRTKNRRLFCGGRALVTVRVTASVKGLLVYGAYFSPSCFSD